MIQYLLKSADFSGLFRFVSPSFFKVVSPKVIFQIATQIKRNQSDHESWEQIVSAYSGSLNRAALGVGLQKGVSPVVSSGSLSSRDLGHRTLELFFHQVLTQETWVLDFRTEAFEVRADGVLWKPKNYYFKPSTPFVNGVRGLYRGFYSGDDSLFDQSLRDLQMEAARESLKAHFGQGDQSSVEFKLKVFQETFTQVFEDCAKTGTQVQGDFFVLGLMLLGLYERLESLGLSLDVRSAFETASKKASLQ
jgi:hypothetical protein